MERTSSPTTLPLGTLEFCCGYIFLKPGFDTIQNKTIQKFLLKFVAIHLRSFNSGHKNIFDTVYNMRPSKYSFKSL